jgi:SAM-dependent methyltransferase
MRRLGPFVFQQNSRTRAFEYPYCYHATPLTQGMRVVDIGAGASGFQFVLAESDISVVSVDPLENPSETVDWLFTPQDFQRINRAFGARVQVIRDYLENAKLESDNYDRVFAISVLEHIPECSVFSLMKEIRRILKPGGLCVATVDLFLDCYPFTENITNQYGRNISVHRLVEESGLALKSGDRCQLYGYREFDKNEVLRRREEFLTWNNVMSQCFVLEKAAQISE